MNTNRFDRWIHNIFNTRDQEISCSECFTLVSRYVDVELAGRDAPAEMPEVRHHLEQCAACREEYETLRDLQRLENEGGLSTPDDPHDLIP